MQTRPIILIECLRKCYIKLLTRRAGIIISKYNVLKGPNYTGLPGESTVAPIITTNAIIEDAREHRKPLWLIAQDMAKAFDSVGMVPLRMAMNRIKLPKEFIDLMIYTFDQRQIAVITHHGLTEPFIAQDGIDQGETISPLLWRIFYDPLLYRIQHVEKLGYQIKLN